MAKKLIGRPAGKTHNQRTLSAAVAAARRFWKKAFGTRRFTKTSAELISEARNERGA